MYDFESIARPRSVSEAVAALEKDTGAIIIASGTDVLLDIRDGKSAGCRLISISGINELRYVNLVDDGDIVIGPLTTFKDLEDSDIIQRNIPILAQAAGEVGGPQIRAVGTIGGNVCNGKTSADTAPSLFTLEAILELTGPDGARYTDIESFYLSAGKTDVRPGELLTAIRIPFANYEKTGGCYIKFAQRRAMDIATTSCAAVIRLSSDGTVESLRLAFGVAAPVPIRAKTAENAAQGQRPGAELCGAIEAALSELKPRTSWRASKQFRERLAREISRRAIESAVEAAREVGLKCSE